MSDTTAIPNSSGASKAPEATLIAVILDRSGSMTKLREATIAGFNEFLSTQQQQTDGGGALMSLTQFDNQYEVNFIGEPIGNVPNLGIESYVPRGQTALYDAIGRTIHEVETWTKERQWQERILVLIITDGQENASREYDLAAVRALIEQKEKEGWNFAYMGANQDSFSEAGKLKIRADYVANFACTDVGTAANFRRMARSASQYRSSGSKGQTAPEFFNPPIPPSDPQAGKKSGTGTLTPPQPRGGLQWLKDLFNRKDNS